jgi:hypothetical protein
MNWKLNSNLTAMSIVAACLILAGGTVVGAYHCYRMLGWIAAFPVAGFLFADYLGFHLIFFARKEKGLLGWSSLLCKFLIFGTLLLNGASLVYLLITEAKDKAAIASKIKTEKAKVEIETAAKMKLIEAESAARRAEETQRAENAAKLMATTGNARLARVVTTTAPAQTIAFGLSVSPSPSPARETTTTEEAKKDAPSTFERFIRWYTRAPLYFSGGLIGLACFILTQVFGKLGADRHGTKPGQVNYQGERTYRILPDGRRQIVQSTYSPEEIGKIVDADEDFPDEIEATTKQDNRTGRRLDNGQTKKSDSGRQSPISDDSFDRNAALKSLREHLKQISFENPKVWFKADLIRGGVKIRLFKKDHGHEIMVATNDQSNKLLRAVNRPDFRKRLIDELIYQGFPIERLYE